MKEARIEKFCECGHPVWVDGCMLFYNDRRTNVRLINCPRCEKTITLDRLYDVAFRDEEGTIRVYDMFPRQGTCHQFPLMA